MIVQDRKKPLFTFNVGYSTALRSAMVKTFNANKPKVALNIIDFLDLYTQLSEVSATWFAQTVTELCFCNLSRCGALLHCCSYFMINMLFFAIDLTQSFDLFLVESFLKMIKMQKLRFFMKKNSFSYY